MKGSPPEPSRGRIVSETVENNAYQTRVEVEQACVLLLKVTYHPNWHAYVDGEERPVLRANYVWKAVSVPAGEHCVEFRYRDPVVAVSRWITLLSSLVLIAALAISLAKAGRKGDADAPQT